VRRWNSGAIYSVLHTGEGWRLTRNYIVAAESATRKEDQVCVWGHKSKYIKSEIPLFEHREMGDTNVNRVTNATNGQEREKETISSVRQKNV